MSVVILCIHTLFMLWGTIKAMWKLIIKKIVGLNFICGFTLNKYTTWTTPLLLNIQNMIEVDKNLNPGLRHTLKRVCEKQIYSVSSSVHLCNFIHVLLYMAVPFEYHWWPQQTKDYKIGICCLSAKHIVLRKNKEWLALNQDNVSEWSDLLPHRLFFQLASTIKIQLIMLVK
jgi:hypothetical protein